MEQIKMTKDGATKLVVSEETKKLLEEAGWTVVEAKKPALTTTK